MPETNIILRLRPASGSAVYIAAALALAVTAAAEQATAATHAKAARDAALLDTDPATLRKAEQALADAREQGERIEAVAAQLKQRHTAAVEAETLANLGALKERSEAAYAAVGAWWTKQRKALAAEFAKGIELAEAANASHSAHDAARTRAMERHPDASISAVSVPPFNAAGWAGELSGTLGWLDRGSRDPVKDASCAGRAARSVGCRALPTAG